MNLPKEWTEQPEFGQYFGTDWKVEFKIRMNALKFLKENSQSIDWSNKNIQDETVCIFTTMLKVVVNGDLYHIFHDLWFSLANSVFLANPKNEKLAEFVNLFEKKIAAYEARIEKEGSKNKTLSSENPSNQSNYIHFTKEQYIDMVRAKLAQYSA